jgi:hypothetical protein
MRTVTLSWPAMNTRSGVHKAFTFKDAAQFEILVYVVLVNLFSFEFFNDDSCLCGNAAQE